MTGQQANLIWKSPGPVSTAFKNCTAMVSAINGPVGGGKTTTCFHRLLDIARDMPLAPDGKAYARFGVIRDTYRNLSKSAITTWHKIVPPTIGRWVGGGTGDPALHQFELRQVVNGVMKICVVEIMFFALGDNTLENVLRGTEFTAVYLNEADMLPPESIPFLLSRVGRYPEKARGGGYAQIILDFNAPEPDNWTFEDFFGDKPTTYRIFVQPGGREPDAENLENLPPNYYDGPEMLSQPEWYLRTMIDNKPGYRRTGSVVFSDFNDRIHVAQFPIKPILHLPLFVGLDAMWRPAVTIWQRVGMQWRGIAELYANHAGPNSFGDSFNLLMARDFADCHDVRGAADPTAFYGDPDEEQSAYADIFSRKTKVKFKPAPSNALSPRLDAVRIPLKRKVDGEQPEVIISPVMIQTRAAFNGKYKFREKRTSEKEEEDTPHKNHPWSDLMDTVQYVFLTFGDTHEVRAREKFSGNGKQRIVRAKTGFNVFA